MNSNQIFDIISECSYPMNTKDYVGIVVLELFNLDKGTTFYKVMKSGDKIIVAHYKVKVSFKGKIYDVPLLIYLPKIFPKSPPEIYIENQTDIGINPANKDIDPETKKINVKSVTTWNVYSTISVVMEEIKTSFQNNFPIYKRNNSVSSSTYSNTNSTTSNTNSLTSVFQGINIGGSHGHDNKRIKSNDFNNQNNYNNSNYNNIYNSTYQNNNFQNNQNTQNNQNYGYQYNNNFGNNNNFNTFPTGNNNITNITNSNYQPNQGRINYDAEIKKKLIEELKNSLEPKLKEEIHNIKKQEEILNKYKKEFTNINESLAHVGQDKNKAVNLLNDYIISINDEVNSITQLVNKLKNNHLTEDNYQNFIEYNHKDLMRACCVEASMEDLISVIKKAFDKGIFQYEETLRMIRHLTKEMVKVRFYKEKLSKLYSN